MTNPLARPAANLPITNPSAHQQASGGTLNPIASSGLAIFAETQAAYLRDAQSPSTLFNGELGEPGEPDGPEEAA